MTKALNIIGSKSKDRLYQFWICAALTIAVIAVYYPVCTYDFVNYDDNIYVYENPNIQGSITLEAAKWAFTTDYASYWNPLTWLSFMIDWHCFGPDASGYHFVNLLLHIANTLLLFIVLKQMTQKLWPSVFVAAAFALHPLHVESVAWITERKDVLSTFFWMLTMWAYARYVRGQKIINYLMAVVFFSLGLMSKPMLVTLPFVLLLLDYWPLERFPEKRSWFYLLIEKAPLFAMALALCIVTFIIHKKGEVYTGEDYNPLIIRLANASISYMQYIAKMILPVDLAVLYPQPRTVSISYTFVSLIFLLVVTILVLRFAKDHRYLPAGWFWYLGTLVPVIGIVQTGYQALADRYTYITLTGLFIIIAWGLPELVEKWPRRKPALWAASLTFLFVMAVCAHVQQQYWKDSITLFQHTLEVTSNNYVAHTCIANAFLKNGRIEKAIRHNIEAIRIKPNFLNAVNGLGFAFYKAGRTDEAIHSYERALEISPGAAEIRVNLSAALTVKGDFSQAAEECEKVLLVQPRNAAAHNNMGIALFRLGKFDEAIEHFRIAIQIAPGFKAARDGLDLALAEKQKLQGKDTENAKK